MYFLNDFLFLFIVILVQYCKFIIGIKIVTKMGERSLVPSVRRDRRQALIKKHNKMNIKNGDLKRRSVFHFYF